MKIISFETTTEILSVSLRNENQKIVSFEGKNKLLHLSELIPSIKKILEENELKLKEIDALAVSIGPGSYTGMRIGIGTARAISQATGIPVIPVLSLNALPLRNEIKTGETIAAILDGRGGEIYGGVFEKIAEKKVKVLKEVSAMTEEDFKNSATKFSPKFIYMDKENFFQRSREILLYAEGRIEIAGNLKKASYEYEAVKPAYLRVSAAEKKLLEKKL